MKAFKSILTFQKEFDTNEKCQAYLEQQKWGGTPCCTACASTNVTRFKKDTRRFQCNEKGCCKQFSVLQGTFAENTKIPLTKWFLAMYILNNHSKGISSLQLAGWLDVTQKTAWFLNWNIEILFKSWKSGLNIEKMIPEAQIHTERIESILYLMLLYIAWFQMMVYAPLRWDDRKPLSVIKVAKWMVANTIRWIDGEITLAMKREILFYCQYDTRRRVNATGHLEQFFSGLT